MRVPIRSVLWSTITLTVSSLTVQAQENSRAPIIDMHVHAYPLSADLDLDFSWLPEGVEAPSSTESGQPSWCHSYRRRGS